MFSENLCLETGLCELAGDWYVDWITMPEEMFSFLKRFCSNGLLKELKAVLLLPADEWNSNIPNWNYLNYI